MRRIAIWTTLCVVCLLAGTAQAQNQFSIRAASSEPVDGWQWMYVQHSDRVVWVSPVAALVASDIEKAEPDIRDDGHRIIKVVFTDVGAKKIHDLTTAQFKKLVALVVDDRLIWAPVVQAIVGKETVLTGNLPGGLTSEEVERIMASLR
jgi:preprotein translocase subunit SecD